MNPTLQAWAVPFLFLLAGVLYVTMSTVRIILLSRGHKVWAAMLGFLETILFLLAVGKILTNLDDVANVIGYAGGFALGNYLGIVAEDKLAMGLVIVRIIARQDASALMQEMETRKFGVTSMAARGLQGRVRLIFTVIRRHDLDALLRLVDAYNPQAFVSVEDIRTVRAGNFPRIPRFRFSARTFFWGR